MDQIARLQAWYVSRCDGAWEHGPAVTIDTIDNPGWIFRIPESVDQRFRFLRTSEFQDPDNEDVWVHVARPDPGEILIACGPNNLGDALEVFLRAVGHGREEGGQGPDGISAQIERLQTWYWSKCDGMWEHGYGIRIGTLDNPGWRLEVPEDRDQLLARLPDRLDGDPDEDENWLHVARIKPGIVGIYCGPHRLAEALEIFLDAVGH